MPAYEYARNADCNTSKLELNVGYEVITNNLYTWEKNFIATPEECA
jgi:hypothetical protein